MLVSFVVTVIIFRCAPLVLERHATEWALVVPFLHTRVVRFPHVAVEGAIGEGVDRHGRIELGAILGDRDADRIRSILLFVCALSGCFLYFVIDGNNLFIFLTGSRLRIAPKRSDDGDEQQDSDSTSHVFTFSGL